MISNLQPYAENGSTI